ncbi:3-mercaptopyruvate sulfurtransferase [Sphingobium sufflavum]|uniref:3-mercaptopyruvate sulfurtransferase n=1 Tax=Sphingobium sufflavum TaxID=1129547 RepID=UPI001F1C4751|nr:3-mercaptopyruvate sulfurtransferase [Sphingobium sufflavum]MCE7795328.1 3-mercaptopyruvate sulfurtransferase [Sphingobium sufflavum]
MDLLVSTHWLAGEIGADDVRVVDATYFLPEAGRDAAADYAAAHIPGALYLNLTDLVDATNPLPNSLPSAETFASRMAALGLGDDSRIILYDNSPHHTAARAWWMFTLFGAREVAILDGGLAKWQAEGRPIESGTTATAAPRAFTVSQDDGSYRSKDQVAEALRTGAAQLVDARSASRFTGEEPETRADLASGHMPGARNIPYSRLFHADGTWKRGGELRAIFADAGVALDRPIITTCGSGITAATLSFGAALLGAKHVALYDGSWSEWGADPALPKATGAA